MKSNTLRRTLCVLLAVLTLVSCLVPAVMAAGSPSSEAGKDDQTLYEKKRVSVLFDNSGSMRTLWNTAKDDKRAYYSSYALQMLASMMNDYDELWITPMNVKIDNKNDTRPATIDDAILFPFTTNRENDISDFVSKYMTINREVSYGQKLTPLSNALTPLSSVAVAIESLYREDGATVDHDAKNWIVILTDGKFTDENEKDITEVSTVAAELAKQLDAHEDLHMIYIGLGTAADLSGNATLKKYGDRFVGKLCNAETVVSTMREITNLMCDRYTLDVDVTISKAPDGKTLATVDLSSVPFPLISLSYSIQDFGGTVLNASCGGADYPPTNCVITPPAELGLQSGCTGVIRDSAKENPVLFNTDDTGKTMVLTLSKEVSADNIVLMAEPALYMTPVFQYEKDGAWVEGTLAELSKKLKAGDEIKVGYRVRSGSDDKVFNTDTDLPGKTFGTVTYDGDVIADDLKGVYGDPAASAMSDPIALVTGKNKIKLNVSLMDGVYRLETEVTVDIIGSTVGYDLKGTVDSISKTKSKHSFTAYKGSTALTAEELSEYNAKMILKNAEGEVVIDNVPHKLEGNAFVAEIDLDGYPFGEYSLVMSLDHTRFSISMGAQTIVSCYPSGIDVVSEGASVIEKTESGFRKSQKNRFVFSLYAVMSNGAAEDKSAMNFENGIFSYEVYFEGNKLPSDAYSVKKNDNKLTFIPDMDSVGKYLEDGPKDYTVTVKVFSEELNIRDEETVTLRITESTVLVKIVGGNDLPIDRFDVASTPSDVVFAVYCDDEPLGKADLYKALGRELPEGEEEEASSDIGKLTINSPWCDNPLLPVKLAVKDPEEMVVDGQKIYVVRAVIERGHNGILAPLRIYSARWICNGEKEISATYVMGDKSSTAQTVFVLAKSSWWSYLWRTLLLWLIGLIIFYLLTNNKKSLRHKAGYVVTVSLGGSTQPTITGEPINQSTMQRFIKKRLIWPLSRQTDKGNHYIRFTFNTPEPIDVTTNTKKRKKTRRKSRAYAEQELFHFTDKTIKSVSSSLITLKSNWQTASDPETNGVCTTVSVTASAIRDHQAMKKNVQNGNKNAAGNIFAPGQDVTDSLSDWFVYYGQSSTPQALIFFVSRGSKKRRK